MTFEFWAKSQARNEELPARLSVPHHGLNVAAVGVRLLDLFPPPVGLNAATVAALLALHDLGKFSRPFQAKVPALWPTSSLGPYAPQPGGYPHDAMGYWLLGRRLSRQIAPLFAAGESAGERASVLAAIAGHHGRPPALEGEPSARVVCPACLSAASAFVDAVLELLGPRPLPAMRGVERAAFVWWLAGFTTLADWIGSAWRWFPPIAEGADEDLALYWHEKALPVAARALAEAGLTRSGIASPRGLATLFPDIGPARPLQAWAGLVALPEGAALFVIEDATGAGKTEAALLLAHRLLAAGRGQGLYFALPTTATADAMYARLAEAYRRLFVPGATPSLVLAHGRRRLHEGFSASVLDHVAAAAEPVGGDAADLPAGAQCAAWIEDDRRKAFFGEIGVGTIDQALLAVLPARHAMLRLLGLSRRVLIVDEAHAYDAYMAAELARLLEFHGALGGSAIVLSATLARRQRGQLASAFRAGLRVPGEGLPEVDDYPLATVVSRAGITAEAVPLAEESGRRVAVVRVADAGAAAHALEFAARAGGAVCWVRNTVDDAIAGAALLRARGLEEVMLFHARFAMGDRLAVERRVVARFGKHSPEAARRGAVLVATQVVESSLDIDFDLMVSDLAPADLLIQRAGRVWRHARERPVPGPTLLVLSPEPVDDPAADWLGTELRGAGAVYRDTALLWRSARHLLAAGAIDVPGNVRVLVEAAYDRDAPGAVPSAMARASSRAEGDELAHGAVARQNLLRFDQPYAREAGLWEPDVRTPTRLSEETVTFRLARLNGGVLRPLCDADDTSRAGALSEITIRKKRCAAPLADIETDPLLAGLRAGWARWERELPVLVLRGPAEGPWKGQAQNGSGGEMGLAYARESGLMFFAGNL